MKKRNLLLILFVLALPLMVLYFLYTEEEEESFDEKPKSEDSEPESGFTQNKASEKSKVENQKSKNLKKQENLKSESVRTVRQNGDESGEFLNEQRTRNVKELGDRNLLTLRQSEIFDFIKQNKEVKMQELRNKFKNVTERTLRRDLGKLQDLNLISKKGSTKSATYFFL